MKVKRVAIAINVPCFLKSPLLANLKPAIRIIYAMVWSVKFNNATLTAITFIDSFIIYPITRRLLSLSYMDVSDNDNQNYLSQ